ncbi:S8 family peptidase [Aliikangiella coralliicola]|uniref:S8/S53 family peptidase n=1 Tax=Aliikangiella coralliicola TaxID=2592383 RepID=A0A545UES0_9GAMM|nr:S8/S53 family peptidase [Aliikangiella coralliicola]TQV87971.1 S8/S53 family peptidase [Aliikangiella coralliicola]
MTTTSKNDTNNFRASNHQSPMEIRLFKTIIKSLFYIATLGFALATKLYANTHFNNQKNEFCSSIIKKCIPIDSLIRKKANTHIEKTNTQQWYVEFDQEINQNSLQEIFENHHLSKVEARQLVQRLALQLNKNSVNNYINKKLLEKKRSIKSIKYIALNNSAIFSFTKIGNALSGNNLENNISTHDTKINADGQQKSPALTIAVIDSGVSTKHEQLNSISITQFNPLDNDYSIKDTGLGHGTGILSLLAAKGVNGQQPGLLPDANYLSCNGLPGGKYKFLTTLQCMNWIFLQPKVDVLVNAWLASTPGCKNEWNYPIQVLWLANTVPVFAVGNYGKSQETNYSPANLNPFGNSVPLLSVGAIEENGRRLETSSFGLSQCAENRTLPTIMAPGKDLTVAVPFTPTSYQRVNGTSYAVAFVGAAIARLLMMFPEISNEKITNSLLETADDLGEPGVDSHYGHGKFDLSRTISKLRAEKK